MKSMQAMTFRALAALLSYPEQDLLDALDDVQASLSRLAAHELDALFALLQSQPLVRLQEHYVGTFDRNPSHSLHLFEHIHGESRDRGQAMVDLLAEYRKDGFEPAQSELPDYVPLFVEFLSVIEAKRALALLNDAVHVLAAIGDRLAKNGSPYAGVFRVIQSFASIAPQALQEPPVRDMDEALEVFGPSPDGTEPLLTPATTHVLRFQPGGSVARPASAPPHRGALS